MQVTLYEVLGIMSAVLGVLMLGSRDVRFQFFMYSAQIWIIASETAFFAYERRQPEFYIVALTLLLQRAILIPIALYLSVRQLKVSRDPGMILPAPLAMHLSIALFGLSFFVAQNLPTPGAEGGMVIATATGSIAHIFIGLVMMLTRRLALSQVVGFLTLENGVYLFALTQTDGLPLFIELAVLIDIFGAVMIAGVVTFSIKKSFEHIDVSRLTDLKH